MKLPAGKLLVPASLALLLVSCATPKEGTVVAKRFRPADPTVQRLGPVYSVEFEGRTESGKTRRRTVMISEAQWSRLEVGDHFSVAERSPTGPALLRPLVFGSGESRAARRKPAAPQPEQHERERERPAEEGMLDRLAGLFRPSREEENGTHREGRAAQAKKRPAAKHRPTEKPEAVTTASATPQPSAQASPTAAAASPTAKAKPSPTPARKELSYDQAVTKASEDLHIRELKQKIHAAQSEEDQRKAANEYYRAFYGKVRELAPSAKERIDKEEASKRQ